MAQQCFLLKYYVLQRGNFVWVREGKGQKDSFQRLHLSSLQINAKTPQGSFKTSGSFADNSEVFVHIKFETMPENSKCLNVIILDDHFT